VTHLKQGSTQTTDHSAQYDKKEGEWRALVIPEVDKKLGDVSTALDDRFPINILRFLICILRARKRFIGCDIFLLIVWNLVG
jgi:hypothetical protein